MGGLVGYDMTQIWKKHDNSADMRSGGISKN